jgi:putative transposase
MREPFDSAAIYHIYNRGVDKRVIFSSQNDFQRFYESLYLFNNRNYRHPGGNSIENSLQLAGSEVLADERDRFVQVIAFCLKPNHYHLLLKQLHPGGISDFLHRLAMGYTKYFNLKHERTGRLFESSYKLKPADWQEHLDLLPRYIHLNVLDGTPLEWRLRDRTIDWNQALEILNRYPWSSHSVYMYGMQLLPVVDETAVRELFPDGDAYWKYITNSPSLGDGESAILSTVPVSR